MTPFADNRAAAFGDQGVQQKVAEIDPRISSVKTERSKRAIVPRIVAILAVADGLATHMQEVRAFLPGEIIAVRNLVVDFATDRGGCPNAADRPEGNRTESGNW